MSYKCIIIDDEPLICKLIQKLGSWAEHDIEIISICYDGETAVNEIRQHKPDIVLSDIKVPIYNGIQIIEKTKEAGLSPLFVIISGFSEFEYAQRAVQLKAVDYLVKPINKDTLNDVLAHCCDLLTERRQQSETSKALSDSYEALLWNALLTGKYSCADEQSFHAQYGMVWNSGGHYMISIHVSRPELLENQTLFIDPVIHIWKKYLGNAFCSADTSAGRICVLLNGIAEDETAFERLLQKIFIRLSDLQETVDTFNLTIGCSRRFQSPSALTQAAEEAETAASCRFDRGADSIYLYDALPKADHVRPLLNDTFTNNLIYLSGNLDISKIELYISEFKAGFLQHTRHDFSALGKFGLMNLNAIMSATQYLDQQVMREKFLYRFQFCVTYEDYFSLLLELIHEIIETKTQISDHALSASVADAKEYIQSHYMEKIHLDDVAKAVCLSATYLSAIFKKEMHMSMSEFINTVRIDAAKEMLVSSDASLYSIADACGYSDEKYFQHQFKKIIGITPVQFRRIHS